MRGHLTGDPAVMARSGDFLVIYNRLNSDKLERVKESDVVPRLTRHHPFALYLFSDRDESDWRFINVKYEQEESRRRVLRRFTVGPDERAADRLRTVSEQLSHIAIADNEIDRLTPLEIQAGRTKPSTSRRSPRASTRSTTRSSTRSRRASRASIRTPNASGSSPSACSTG